jgi:hypothetical protein
MDTRPKNTPDQPPRSEYAIHEVQNVIDALGCDAERAVEADDYNAGERALNRAWDLQRATYRVSPTWSGRCRPTAIRDALLAIGSKLNQTPSAVSMREAFYATIDAEVAAGERTVRDAESTKRFAYCYPYSSAATPKDEDGPELSEEQKAEQTKAANKVMRQARNQGTVEIETKYGPCVLTSEQNDYGRPCYYELFTKGPNSVKVERGPAGVMRQALVESAA